MIVAHEAAVPFVVRYLPELPVWLGKASTTPQEEAVIKHAERVTGHKGRLAADRGSHEPTSTNAQSPVAKPKKNRWGV